jgi:hypothetical protein
VVRKRLSRKDFLDCLEVMYEEGPQVKYQNPDAWSRPLNMCVV